MQAFFADPRVEAVILFTLTLIVIAIGAYVVGRLRDRGGDNRSGASDSLTKFREMHARGHLSDEEFRTIKSRLANELQAELNDSENTV